MEDDYSFLKEYPLDYLISNKDKKSDFYQILRNTCVYLLDGHNPDEAELRVSWNIFKMYFLVGIYLEDQLWQKFFKAFVGHFNHSEESSVEFLLWIFSDMVNETLDVDWKTIRNIPIDVSVFESAFKIKPTSKARSKGVKQFFQDYVSQGGEQIPQPSKDDMQSFAKVTLQFIEESKVKAALNKITFGRFSDWLPKEIKKTLDSIGRLTLKDGEMLIAAKPLIENFRGGFSASQSTQKKKEVAKVDFIHELKKDRGLPREELEGILDKFSLEQILTIKDQESNLYTFICSMCLNLLNNPSESERSFAWRYFRAFYKMEERGWEQGIESDQIPEDESLHLLAEITLKIMEEPDKKKEFKSASLGRWRDYFPEDIQRTFNELGEISYKDAKMFIKAKPLLQQWENSYLKSKIQPLSNDVVNLEMLPHKKILNQACIEWASRKNNGYIGKYTREEFLQDFESKTGEFISLDEFKRALRDAEKNGLIHKDVKGRFTVKARP